jgi:hypothetical protein
MKSTYAVTTPSSSDGLAFAMSQMKTADVTMNPVIIPSWIAGRLVYSNHQSGAISMMIPPMITVHFSIGSKKLSG